MKREIHDKQRFAVTKIMQNSKEAKKAARRQFGWLYKVLCQQKSVKPLAAVQAYLKDNCLRFCVDRVALKHWSPILNSIAENRSLSKIYLYSRSLCRRTRETINTEEKLEKLWRCWKDRTWPILYTNFLLRCLLDAVAVYSRDSARLISITIDGIPLTQRYLNILCSGLRNNEILMHLSLTRCRIGDIGCDLLLGCLANNPNLRVLNLSACRLTNRSATSLSLFLNRRRADLLQNVWVESSLQSCEENSTKQTQGLHALILNQNPKFGDNGVRQLIAALNIDYWLKSLSIRHCGITKHGAEAIVKLLQSNSTLVKMDLAQNHIHINTLQVVLKLLRRRREPMESKSLKKRFIRNWKNVSLKNTLRRNKIGELVSKSDKRLCESERRNRRSLKTCSPKRLLRFQRNPSQPKEIRIARKEHNSGRKNISELQSQLLDIIDSNSKLREELSSNNALLDTEVQERSRTEDELQNLSLRLNEVKSRVILVNCLRSKISDESELLQKGFRHIFEKIESFSNTKQFEVDRVALIDTQLPSLSMLRQKESNLLSCIGDLTVSSKS